VHTRKVEKHTSIMGFREINVFLARAAEQAERFEDMVEHMTRVIEIGTGLDSVERNMFSLAYKYYVGSRRTSWRAVKNVEQKEKGKNLRATNEQLVSYRREIEKELTMICEKCLDQLDTQLLPTAVDPETKVHYLKMKGDYLRYLAEFCEDTDAHGLKADSAHEAYRTASDIALAELAPTNPMRLGLALNFSVFYYEVLNSPERACLLSKAAFDDAIPCIEALGDEYYQDSASILQLLRDNLTLWTSDMQENEAPKEET